MANFEDYDEATLDEVEEDTELEMVSDDVQEAYDFYGSVLDGNFPASFDKFYSHPSVQTYFGDIVEGTLNDNDFVMDTFQSIVDELIVTYSMGQLITHAPLSQQHALSPAVIAKLWTAPKIGLKETESFYNPIEVVIRPNGGVLVVGGNHRLGALLLPFVAKGCTAEEIAPINVRCRQYSVNMEVLRSKLSVTTEDGQTIQPSKQTLLVEANKICMRLWLVSNASRTPKPVETKDAFSFELGIDRNDSQSILDGLFGDTKLISPGDAFRHLFILGGNDNLPAAEDDDGAQWTHGTTRFFIQANGAPTVLQLGTVDKIMASFYKQLAGSYREVAATGKDGKPKTVRQKVYQLDLSDADIFEDYASTLTMQDSNVPGTSLFEMAVQATLDGLRGTESEGNIARNYVQVAQNLFNLFSVRHPEPQNKPVVKAAKSKTKKLAPKGKLGMVL